MCICIYYDRSHGACPCVTRLDTARLARVSDIRARTTSALVPSRSLHPSLCAFAPTATAPRTSRPTSHDLWVEKLRWEVS